MFAKLLDQPRFHVVEVRSFFPGGADGTDLSIMMDAILVGDPL